MTVGVGARSAVPVAHRCRHDLGEPTVRIFTGGPARPGVPAALVGAVGDDTEGEHILASLRTEGVDAPGVRVRAGERSGARAVTVDAGRGTRAVRTRPARPRVPTFVHGVAWTGVRPQLLPAADHLGVPVVEW